MAMLPAIVGLLLILYIAGGLLDILDPEQESLDYGFGKLLSKVVDLEE